MARIFKNVKENHKILLEIKQMAPDGKIPMGLLLKGKPAIKDKYKEYLFARDLDKDNEKRPRKSSILSMDSNSPSAH